MLQKNAQQRRLKEVRRMLSKTSVLERPPLHGFDPLLSCREELHVELFSTSVLWHRVHTDFGESGCFVKTLNGPVTIISPPVNKKFVEVHHHPAEIPGSDFVLFPFRISFFRQAGQQGTRILRTIRQGCTQVIAEGLVVLVERKRRSEFQDRIIVGMQRNFAAEIPVAMFIQMQAVDDLQRIRHADQLQILCDSRD